MKPAILILAIVAASLAVGYFVGATVTKKNLEAEAAQNQVQATATPAPTIDTGYQNPFEGVDVNPFR